MITAGLTIAYAQTFQLPQCSFGRTQNKGVTLERQINLSDPADKISSTLVQRSLASGLSGGTRLSFCDMFWLHSFQKETQGTSGKNIGTTGERRIGGNFPDPFQHAFVLLGHLMPCEGKGGAKIDVADRYSVGASRSSFRGLLGASYSLVREVFQGQHCMPAITIFHVGLWSCPDSSAFAQPSGRAWAHPGMSALQDRGAEEELEIPPCSAAIQ